MTNRCNHWACNKYNNTCVGCGTLVCPMCLKEPDDCRCENKEAPQDPSQRHQSWYDWHTGPQWLGTESGTAWAVQDELCIHHTPGEDGKSWRSRESRSLSLSPASLRLYAPRALWRPLLPSMALVSSRARSAMIPLEEDPNTGKNQPHKCEQWKVQHRKYYNCNNCGSEIYFDDARKSKNGKYIPLDKATSQPHQCDE